MNTTVHTLQDLDFVARAILDRAAAGDTSRAVVCTLSGDLGAGKTTLTQAIGKVLGISETMNSPTFVIRKRYNTQHPVFTQLVHIDAYRLTSGEALSKIKFQEDLELPNTLICLEWPEQIADLNLKPDIAVVLQHINETTRTITILP